MIAWLRRVFRVVLMVGFAAPALAGPTPVTLSRSDLADVAVIESALNGVKTLQAHFVQVADNGKQASGTFSLLRPGRMRLVYDPPIKDFIVADGWFVFFWDDELQQQSSQPVGASLADFFLRETIKLSGDISISRMGHRAGTTELSLFETGDPGKGELTLVFEDKPLQLLAWRVVDAQGLTTTVSLSDVRVGVKLNEDMFLFRDPTGGRPSRR